MTEGTEQVNLLGQIQNGFRQSRRGADNLFILSTIINKFSQAKGVNYVAMLDVAKAYDRVCRVSLWHKLQKYKFPEKIIDLLKLLYENPKSDVTFQGMTLKNCEMPLGLRQGCVLSPLLFALYIADLGRVLEKSGLGVKINNTKMAGLFFADDMLLMGDRQNLTAILDIVAQYGANWKIEFSGPKSVVLPFGAKPNPKNKWRIGWTPCIESPNQPIYMQEVDYNKYLGIIFNRGSINMYRNQYEEMKNKAHKMATFLACVIKESHRPILTIKKIWETYGTPVFTYGCEVAHFSKELLHQLEVIQRSFIRRTLSLPQMAPVVGLYAMTRIRPLQYLIAERKMQYLQYLKNTDAERWVHEAFLEQISWAQTQTWINDKLEICNKPPLRGPHWWIRDIINDAIQFQVDISKAWTKLDIKLMIHRSFLDHTTQEIAQRSTLVNTTFNLESIDGKYHHRHHRWWLKARLGGLLLNHRVADPNKKKCKLCNADMDETLSHLLFSCTALQHIPLPIEVQGTNDNERCIDLLHIESTSTKRSRVNKYIKSRWDERCRLLTSCQDQVEVDPPLPINEADRPLEVMSGDGLDNEDVMQCVSLILDITQQDT